MISSLHLLPALRRLSLIAEHASGRLRVLELRVVPARMRWEHWTADEPAFAVTFRRITIDPPRFDDELILMADAGLHSVARRFQRGADRGDAAVLSDLVPLAHAYPDLVATGAGEFEVPAGDGRWIGSVTRVHGAPVLAVRTFVATA